MLDKKLIKQLYKDGYKDGMKMSDIAHKFNVSPQRIHQIVKNYISFRNRNLSFANFPNLRLLEGCRNCGKRVDVIHHKNFNSDNNEEKNLIPLCKKCHYIEHKWLYQNMGSSIRVTRLKKKLQKIMITSS